VEPRCRQIFKVEVDPKDGGSLFIQNIGNNLHDCIVSLARTAESLSCIVWSPPCKLICDLVGLQFFVSGHHPSPGVQKEFIFQKQHLFTLLGERVEKHLPLSEVLECCHQF
jgi:hypothetical protein